MLPQGFTLTAVTYEVLDANVTDWLYVAYHRDGGGPSLLGGAGATTCGRENAATKIRGTRQTRRPTLL